MRAGFRAAPFSTPTITGRVPPTSRATIFTPATGVSGEASPPAALKKTTTPAGKPPAKGWLASTIWICVPAIVTPLALFAWIPSSSKSAGSQSRIGTAVAVCFVPIFPEPTVEEMTINCWPVASAGSERLSSIAVTEKPKAVNRSNAAWSAAFRAAGSAT